MAAMHTFIILVSLLRDSDPAIPDKSFHHEVTESGDELHLAALI